MIHFQVFTVYPEIFSSFLSQGLISKALEDNRLQVDLINFREFGIGKHKKVDAAPYGGGAGMVLRPEPIVTALETYGQMSGSTGHYKVLISPQGKPFKQSKAVEFSRKQCPIALICGRFEGFDERIRSFVDEELSLGDFVLMGGEVVAMAVIESVGRLIPGVIGNEESLKYESFSQGLLEYSQYTRPSIFRGLRVPEVLISGNHGEIENWRNNDSLEKTRRNRADLFSNYQKKEAKQDVGESAPGSFQADRLKST